MRGFEAWDFVQAVADSVFDGSELLTADIAQAHALEQELANEVMAFSSEPRCQEPIAAGALDQGAHRGAVHHALDEVVLPMPWQLPQKQLFAAWLRLRLTRGGYGSKVCF